MEPEGVHSRGAGSATVTWAGRLGSPASGAGAGPPVPSSASHSHPGRDGERACGVDGSSLRPFAPSRLRVPWWPPGGSATSWRACRLPAPRDADAPRSGRWGWGVIDLPSSSDRPETRSPLSNVNTSCFRSRSARADAGEAAPSASPGIPGEPAPEACWPVSQGPLPTAAAAPRNRGTHTSETSVPSSVTPDPAPDPPSQRPWPRGDGSPGGHRPKLHRTVGGGGEGARPCLGLQHCHPLAPPASSRRPHRRRPDSPGRARDLHVSLQPSRCALHFPVKSEPINNCPFVLIP